MYTAGPLSFTTWVCLGCVEERLPTDKAQQSIEQRVSDPRDLAVMPYEGYECFIIALLPAVVPHATIL